MSRTRFSAAVLATLALATITPAQGEYFVGATPITELNQAGSNNWDATLSGDELYMVFGSDRPGGAGSYDLYETSRANVDATWSPPVNLAALNTAFVDYEPHLSFDGLELHFVSDRPGSLGVFDIWVSTRANTASPWGAPANLGAEINGAALQNQDPALTDDGLTMFYNTGTSLWTARRSAIGQPWTNAGLFAPANVAGFFDHSPIAEGGGDLVWFASDRPGGPGGASDYYFVTKDPVSNAYGAPVPVADMSTADWDSNAARGRITGRMYRSQFIGGFGTLWVSCPRGVVVSIPQAPVVAAVPHSQTVPARTVWRRLWRVSVNVGTVTIYTYRWTAFPTGGLSVLVVSLMLNDPPVPGPFVLPGAEGDLYLGGSPIVLAQNIHPPAVPVGLEAVPLPIPANPALVGLGLHLQNAGFEIGTNQLTLSQAGTIRLAN